jgi:hydroxymethylglutaryl-CoA reductase (NADPH)
MKSSGRPSRGGFDSAGWPRKNTAEQIRGRQARIRELDGWRAASELVFDWPAPPESYASLVESLTATVTLPVSMVGPLPVSLGRYQLDPADGSLVEVERQTEEVYVPLAHSEGGLSASMQRGIAAVLGGEPVTTCVISDRITRDSCFLFRNTMEAVTFGRWISSHTLEIRAWLHDERNPLYAERVRGIPRLSRHAQLWEIDTHVLGAACHVLYRYTTGDACGPNMTTRNSSAINTEFVLKRFASESGIEPLRVLIEANMGGDKKPSAQYFSSGGHGKTVVAGVTVSGGTLRRVLHTTAEDLTALEHLGVHGSHASGMQSAAFSPASAVAAIFAATGQDLGMVGTSSMAHDVLDSSAGGIHLAIRFPGLEVGTVGGGTGMPHARAFLGILGCLEPGGSYRLAQVVAAAALCLELSASAAAATVGSRDFVVAHTAQSGRSPGLGTTTMPELESGGG